MQLVNGIYDNQRLVVLALFCQGLIGASSKSSAA